MQVGPRVVVGLGYVSTRSPKSWPAKSKKSEQLAQIYRAVTNGGVFRAASIKAAEARESD
jgi:hypothetical protein